MPPLVDLAARLDLTWANAGWGVLLLVISAGGSLAFVTTVLVRLPAAYFLGEGPVLGSGGLPARIAKNLLGAMLVAIGLVLAIPGVPGQGALTILLGVMLLDFPGKRRIERRFVSRPRVRRAVDDLRGRFGRPPLVLEPADLPPDEAAQDSTAPKSRRGSGGNA